MKFSAQQDAALSAVDEWLKHGTNPFFYLAGYAGTGKTTLAKHFAETVGGDVLFAAYTGKAASVMRDKGCRDATTIHRLIYQPSSKSTQRLRKLQDELKDAQAAGQGALVETLRKQIIAEVQSVRSPNFNLNPDSDVRGATLLIIDECSMINPNMGEDLLSFGTKVLVLGDPAQLPPVQGAGYFTNGKPDVMLTDIHRQARESGILRMATEIRNGRIPKVGTDYGDARVIPRGDVDPMEMTKFDQILVGRNGTRQKTNHRMRDLLGFEGSLPKPDDKIVCLRNNHDLGLLNGGLWKVLDAMQLDEEKIGLTIEDDDGGAVTVEAWNCFFLGEQLAHYDHSSDVQEFDYGYVLTVHKSQGSEWRRVAVMDESKRFPMSQNPLPWLYTAVTRASEELLLFR